MTLQDDARRTTIVNVLNIREEAGVVFVTKIDEYGKGAWIALTAVALWLYWPIGLALLAFLLCSGRVRAWREEGPGRWYNAPNGSGSRSFGCGWGGAGRSRRPSGNWAFDEHRTETLRRLEEEQREFIEYLERLRRARDKAEFDQFMAERRGRTEPPETPEAG
jgi:hypothetical protein